MKANEVCKKLGISYKCLRIYEEKEIIVPKRQEENNYRSYSSDDILKLKCIKTLRELGLSLEEIKNMISGEFLEKNINQFYTQMKILENQLIKLSAIKETLNFGINFMLESQKKMEKPEEFYKGILEMEKEFNCKMAEKNKMVNEWKNWKFDKFASNYIEYFFKEDLEYIEGIKILRQKILQEKKGIKILDIGCGTGEVWKDIEDHIELHGLDCSLNMLTMSNQNLKKIKLHYGDILSENIAEKIIEKFGKMEMVILCFTLHHIEYENQFKALENIIKLVDDNKKILIIDRMFQNAKTQIEIISQMEPQMAAAVSAEFYCHAEQLEKFIKKSGLNVKINHVFDQLWVFEVEKK